MSDLEMVYLYQQHMHLSLPSCCVWKG
jgi:hypothetical protein